MLVVAQAALGTGCWWLAGIEDVSLAGDARVDSTTKDARDETGGGDDGGTKDTTVIDTNEGRDTDPSVGHCAALHGSSEMLRIDVTTPAWSYCIDKYETTVKQFNDFLVAEGDPFDAPPFCASQRSPRQLRDPDPSHQDLAASGVHWCYATAYCHWVGKRLCRDVGGALPGYDNSKSEWKYACANGKLNDPYPYGPTLDDAACNVAPAGDASASSVQKPGAFPACHGEAAPFDTLYDMTGNVAETDDYVSTDTIRMLGGGFNDGPYSCTGQGGFSYVGGAPSQMGIRCCGDL